MAEITNTPNAIGAKNEFLFSLLKHPMFADLQEELLSECSQITIPYTLCYDSDHPTSDVQASKISSVSRNSPISGVNKVLVQEATLLAEFKQLKPLQNSRVGELENFYNSESSSIVTKRSDAIAALEFNNQISGSHYYDLQCCNRYYDEELLYLMKRVAESLHALKKSLPSDTSKIGGCTKRQKSRLLDPIATNLMSRWYQDHIEHPYPSDAEKEMMAEQGGICVSQVKAWFANKRNRTLNTRPKRQQMRAKHNQQNISRAPSEISVPQLTVNHLNIHNQQHMYSSSGHDSQYSVY